jgi:hypothetical protein
MIDMQEPSVQINKPFGNWSTPPHVAWLWLLRIESKCICTFVCFVKFITNWWKLLPDREWLKVLTNNITLFMTIATCELILRLKSGIWAYRFIWAYIYALKFDYDWHARA